MTMITKFSEMVYEKIDITEWEISFLTELNTFKLATTIEDKIQAVDKMNGLRATYDTMQSLASIRHTIDTKDEFYDEQESYFNKIGPKYEGAISLYYQALVEDGLKEGLEAHYGAHLFNLAKIRLKTFNIIILEDLELENNLSSQYTKLRADVKIQFDGKVLNISQMGPYLEVVDRTSRKSAHEALEAAYQEKEEAFDALYHELVQVRHRIAQKLGFDNFTELGYARLARTDYGPNDVKVFRDSVYETLVPKLAHLYEKQKKRLGLETLAYYDLGLGYLSGNPVPKGDSQWLLDQGKAMYQSLSPQTSVFISDMLKGEWMDLDAKPGKAGGGYCNYIPNYRAPFIFSNFNGTMGDVDVLTHEAGHAFQVYQSRDFAVPEYLWPTLEACEIHSMSMEFLTYPFMHLFFKEDTTKYFFSHMSSAIMFIPYGVLVDEFQHWVYENPNAEPAMRKSKWRELEKKYQPHLNYEGHEFLESGTYWYRQGHIFNDPFYYIDYTLAAVCAFQFWEKSQKNPEATLVTYSELCQLGGSLPFTQLVDRAGLMQPFKKGSLESTVEAVVTYLDAIDDTVF